MMVNESPEWMGTWLSLPFYENGEKCRMHAKKYNTVYCGACMQRAVCEVCWDKNHPHHQILKVCRASRRAAITLTDIRRFLDVSDIQVYSINSKSIVFLNPNVESAIDAAADRRLSCQTCNRKLISSEYRFCSIACKHVQNEGGDMELAKKCEQKSGSSVGSSDIASTTDQCKVVSVLSKRKRSRKGIPCRAPLK